jgi:hypothetical protein
MSTKRRTAEGTTETSDVDRAAVNPSAKHVTVRVQKERSGTRKRLANESVGMDDVFGDERFEMDNDGWDAAYNRLFTRGQSLKVDRS